MNELEKAKEQSEEAARQSIDFPSEGLQEFTSGEDLVKTAQNRLESLKATYSQQLGFSTTPDIEPIELPAE